MLCRASMFLGISRFTQDQASKIRFAILPVWMQHAAQVLQKGRDNWNQPLWRQLKGASWLFSSPDGFWRFANNDLERIWNGMTGTERLIQSVKLVYDEKARMDRRIVSPQRFWEK